jgi:hypothetical protein
MPPGQSPNRASQSISRILVPFPLGNIQACPLQWPNKDFKEPAFSPIGTISFDSSKPLKETPFDSPEGKKLAELVAGTIFELLKILTT